MSGEPLLRVEGLAVHFLVTEGVFRRVADRVRAVDGVSFEIGPGETLGLVGESGCGKTTLGRAILRLVEPTAGRVVFEGVDVGALAPQPLRALRRDLQIVFQDPFGSLNPRMTALEIVGESLAVHGIATGAEVERRVIALLERVGIPRAWIRRYPHEFSGGQRQRIGIARAIAMGPKLVVCDEPVSALDVSIQAQVIELLIALRRELGLAYLFIAHDLAVVRHIADRIAVMYLGQIVETASAQRLFRSPAHPYTRALLSAVPVADPHRVPERVVLEGDVPSPRRPPAGCRFHTRCPAVVERCRREAPRSVALAPGHSVRCVHADDLESGVDGYPRMLARLEAAVAANRGQRVAPVAAGVAGPARTNAGAAVREAPAGRRPLAGPFALALVAGGSLLALLGAPVAGVGAGAVGLAMFLGSAPRPRRAWAAGLVAGIALSVLGGRALEARADRREAEAQLAALALELERVSAIQGGYPTALDALGWRLVPIFGDARAVDPWGRAWRYRPPDAAGASFALGSLGPDGAPDTGDEIGRPPPAE
jgi:oligopeptide/dipeptide ABC transporter ATP-binding protein